MIGLRLLFATALLLLPAELLAQRHWGAEPYPAIFQPSFGGAPEVSKVAHITYPRVIVTFADGRRREVPARSLVPDVRGTYTTLLKSAFGTQELADRPVVRAYVRTWVAKSVPHPRRVTRVTVIWEGRLVSTDASKFRPDGEPQIINVDLGGHR